MAAPERKTVISYRLNRARFNEEELVAIMINQTRHPDRMMRMTFPDGETATYNPHRQYSLSPNNLFNAMCNSQTIEIFRTS